MQNPRSPSSRERGQNLVEFALVLPVILILMIGAYNLGLLFLRITDAGFIADAGAVAAARYGGHTDALAQSVNDQVSHSFLSGERNFSWRLETRSAAGELVCSGGPGPDPGIPSPRCTCNWGEQVVFVASYGYRVDALFYAWQGTYRTEKSALCWRGIVPGGPAGQNPQGGR
jgi:hypothetical protein